MIRIATFTGAVAAATLSSITAASAHTPNEIVDILQEHGYSRIEFTDASPPNYMANACRNGVRYHFHVSFYGDVTERSEVGSCGRGRHYGHRAERSEQDDRVYAEQPQQHRRWGGWRRWNRWNSWN